MENNILKKLTKNRIHLNLLSEADRKLGRLDGIT